MSYNVWSREDVALYKRMQAIGRLVCQHSPDVIFFQLSELPLENYTRWRFGASPTGRGYLEADITPAADGSSGSTKQIRIATTQLECPTSPESMHCTERYMQAEHAVAALGGAENVVFGGDMSWDDNTDMPFPLPAGWIDAGSPYEWTYNGVWNEKVWELNGYVYEWVHDTKTQQRSDRFVCKLQD